MQFYSPSAGSKNLQINLYLYFLNDSILYSAVVLLKLLYYITFRVSFEVVSFCHVYNIQFF